MNSSLVPQKKNSINSIKSSKSNEGHFKALVAVLKDPSKEKREDI